MYPLGMPYSGQCNPRTYATYDWTFVSLLRLRHLLVQAISYIENTFIQFFISETCNVLKLLYYYLIYFLK